MYSDYEEDPSSVASAPETDMPMPMLERIQTVRDLSVLDYEDLGLEAIVPTFITRKEDVVIEEESVKETEIAETGEQREETVGGSVDEGRERKDSFSNLDRLYKKLKEKQAILVSTFQVFSLL